jgi:hypothetical protein
MGKRSNDTAINDAQNMVKMEECKVIMVLTLTYANQLLQGKNRENYSYIIEFIEGRYIGW